MVDRGILIIMKESNDRYSANALVRGLEIITLFNDERPNLSLTEIAKLLDVSRTVPYRLLYTLESLGYLRQRKKSKRYELTPKVLELGFSYLNCMGLVEIAQPYLESLRDELDISSHLSTLDGTDVVYIGTSTIRGITAINVNVGLRLKAHAVANGRLLLAYQPDDYIEKHFNEKNLTSFTDQTTTDFEEFQNDINEIKKKGYAISLGEFLPSVNSVAVPIFNVHNEIVAALNVVGTDERLSEQSIINEALPKLQKVAKLLSNYQGTHP